MQIKIILLLIMFFSFSFAQSGRAVKEYPQDFSQRALNTLRAEMADSTRSRYLEDYGAKGDGVTNDYNAFVNAINSGYRIMAKSNKEYLISTTDSTLRFINKNFWFEGEGNGCRVVFGQPTLTDTLFPQRIGALEIESTLNLDEGDDLLKENTIIRNSYFLLYSTAGLSVGDIIILRLTGSSRVAYNTDYGITLSETHIINKINGDTVFVREPIKEFFSASEDTIEIRNYTPIKINIKNIEFAFKNGDKIAGSSGLQNKIMEIHGAYNSEIKNVTIDSAGWGGIEIQDCVNITLDRLNITNSISTTQGYGLSIEGCSDITIQNSSFYNNRGAIDFAGRNNRNMKVLYNTFRGNSIVYDGQRGAGHHQGVEGTLWQGNTFEGLYTGLYLRGENDIVVDNIFRAIGNACISIGESGKGLIAKGNTYDTYSTYYDTEFDSTLNPLYFVYITSLERDTTAKWVIKENDIRNLRSAFVAFSSSTDDSLFYNMDISENSVYYDPVGSAVNYLVSGGVYLYNSKIKDNLTHSRNDYQQFHSSMKIDTTTVQLDVGNPLYVQSLTNYFKIYQDTLIYVMNGDTSWIFPRRPVLGPELAPNSTLNGNIDHWNNDGTNPFDTWQYDAGSGGLEIIHSTGNGEAEAVSADTILLSQGKLYHAKIMGNITNMDYPETQRLRWGITATKNPGSPTTGFTYQYIPRVTGNFTQDYEFTSAVTDTVMFSFYQVQDRNIELIIYSISVKEILMYR